MEYRLVELLVLLMDEYGGESLPFDQIDHVSEDLIRRGFTEQEIKTAFYWLYHRFGYTNPNGFAQAVEIQDPAETSCRILDPVEQRYLTPAALGQLLQLLNLNIISQKQMERIIESALLSEYLPVEVEEIRSMLQHLLFEDEAFRSMVPHHQPLRQGKTFH